MEIWEEHTKYEWDVLINSEELGQQSQILLWMCIKLMQQQILTRSVLKSLKFIFNFNLTAGPNKFLAF